MARTKAHRWSIVTVLALVAALVVARPAAAQVEVDLELVLAVDISRSVDDDEFALQMQGYVAAFSHPAVIRAIQAGVHRSIVVTYVQWAGPLFQAQTIPWTLINDAESASIFADALHNATRANFGGGTSLSGIIDYAVPLFDRNDYVSPRRVVDISGDGINNSGRQVANARDEAVHAGVIINGLAILSDYPSLDSYFREFVAGGPGAFVLAAENFESFAAAIINKLIREIADIPASSLAAFLAAD
jgi:Protein of unknown function (DUF1194)